MNAQAITDRILQDARSAASAALNDARARADELHREYEADAAAKRQKALEQANNDASVLRDRMLRMAELEARKAQLAVKREVIDQAFADALKRMRDMSEADKCAYILRVVANSAEGGEELIADKAEKHIYTDAFMNDLNRRLHEAGKKPVTLASETRELGGGCLLRQGGMEVNLTYPSALGEARAAIEADVAKILFD